MDDIKGGFQIPNFLWSGLIFASMAIITYVNYGPPLVSHRPRETTISTPSVPQAPDSVLTKYARLWEDPLTWSCQTQTSKDEDYALTFSAEGKLPLILPVLLGGNPDAHMQELRIRSRYAVLAALAAAKYRPESASTLRHLAVRRSPGRPWIVAYELFSPDMTESSHGNDRNSAYSQVLVCWVNEEHCADQPLASLRALIDAIYFHSNLATLQKAVCAESISKAELQVGVIGPSNSDALVKMAQENDKIQPRKGYFGRPRLECTPWREEWAVAVHVYSPRATLEPSVLQSEAERQLRVLTQHHLGGPAGGGPATPRGDSCVAFTDVIGTDWHLLHVLRGELESRGLWPNPLRSDEEVVVLTEMDSAYGRGIAHLINWLYDPAKVWLEKGTVEQPQRLMVESADFNELYGVNRVTLVRIGNKESCGTFELVVAGRCREQLRLKPATPTPKETTRRWTVRCADGRSAGHLWLTSDSVPDGQPCGEWQPKQLSVYKYLRGIDGRTGGEDSKQTPAAGPSKAQGTGLPQTVTTNDCPPTGTAQYDYLRRLEVELTALHLSQRRQGGRGILAIGVMGTDVYDKLLILRTLRRRFPEVCFFTTDMDAEYLRPSELPFTRNLIVASHFGLALHPRLQRETPPFRDVYQTATYLATLLALNDHRAKEVCELIDELRGRGERPHDHCWWPLPVARPSLTSEKPSTPWLNQDPWLQVLRDPWNLAADTAPTLTDKDQRLRRSYLAPLLFEIGYNAPYQLSLTTANRALPYLPPAKVSVATLDPITDDTSSVQAHVQPPSPRQAGLFPATMSWWCVAFVAAVVLFSWSFLSAVRKFFTPIVDVAQFVAAGLWALACFVGYDCLAWVRTSKTARPLLGERFHARCAKLARSDPAIAWKCGLLFAALLAGGWLTSFIVAEHSRDPWGEPFAWAQGISIWPSTLIRLLVVLLTVVLAWKGMSDLEHDVAALLGPRPLPSLRQWLAWLWRAPRCTLRRLGVWGERYAEPVLPSTTTRHLLGTYGRRVSRGATLLRAFLWSLLYLAVASTLFQLADAWPNMPARNAAAAGVGQWVLFASVCTTIYLAFFVVDATEQCRRFVTALGRAASVWPQRSTLIDTDRLRDEPEAADELATVQVIGRHTRVVGKLLLYPFWAMLLLVVARHSIFDGWDLPLPLLLLTLTLLLLFIIHALLLRHEADKTRTAVLKRLRRHLLAANENVRKTRIAWTISEVERQRDGAFRPLTEDSLFIALAILFSGSGGLVLLEQLLPRAW
jgi:hypothetical protein